MPQHAVKGYEDLNDHQGLREDPLFQVPCERGIQEDLPLASPPTLCRLENRVDRKALAKMAEVFVEVFIRFQTTTPEELILDFDPANDPVHGNQEQRFFGKFVYGVQTWDRERRVLVKAEHLELGPNTRFLVTNLAGEPQRLYDRGLSAQGPVCPDPGPPTHPAGASSRLRLTQRTSRSGEWGYGGGTRRVRQTDTITTHNIQKSAAC